MRGYKLSLQMRGKLRYRKACLAHHAYHFIAVILALGRLLQVEEPRVPTGNLHPLVTQARSPLRHAIQRIEGRIVRRKLRQKNPRPFDGFHRFSPE